MKRKSAPKKARDTEEVWIGNKINGEYCLGAGCCSCEPERCEECGKSTERDRYLVRDKIWAEAGMNLIGFLCTPCLENRLGRKLTGADYL
jgi:hypothetical protein